MSPHNEADYFISTASNFMTSKQVTSRPWNSRRLVHSKEMAWASRWSVALRAFYRQILSSSNCKDFFFKWHRPPRKLAKEVFVKFIPAKEKTRFAKEWRKVLAKDHVIRIDSHEVFNTAQLCFSILGCCRSRFRDGREAPVIRLTSTCTCSLPPLQGTTSCAFSLITQKQTVHSIM